MKELIYKGFGFDNEIQISFSIAVEKIDSDKVKVEVFSNIPFKKGALDRIRAEHSSLSSDERKTLHIAGSLNNHSFMNCFSDNLKSISRNLNRDNIDDYIFCKNITWEDVNPLELSERLCLITAKCSNFKMAVSFVRETVSLYRNYWKEQKGEYNKLVAELKDLKIEDFVDLNTVDEIILSQTVRV